VIAREDFFFPFLLLLVFSSFALLFPPSLITKRGSEKETGGKVLAWM